VVLYGWTDWACFGAYCDIYLARLSVVNVNGRYILLLGV